MDARSTAAARAVRLVVSQANDAAVAENVRLRCAVERAVVAVEQGDRVLALRLLAVALSRDAVPIVPIAPRTRGQVCVCVVRCAQTNGGPNASDWTICHVARS